MAVEKKTRLLIVGPRGIVGHEGGVEKFAEEFVLRARHRATLSALVLKETGREPPDVEILRVPSSNLLKTDKAWYLLYAIKHILSGRFDTLFILGINFAMLTPIARLMGMRVVVRSGSIDHQVTKWGPVMAAVFRFSEKLASHAQAVVAVAPSISTHLKSIGIDNIVIRNGLDKKPRQQSVKRRGVVAIGRITAQKNFGVLLEVAHLLAKDCPPIRIIGGADSSPESSRLDAMMDSLNVRDQVTFTGSLDRDQVLEELESAAIYVNCSHHEGMSNAVLEAIQQGTPVLLSDIPANRDLELAEQFYFQATNAAQLSKAILHGHANAAEYTVNRDSFDDWDSAVAKFCDVLNLPPQPDFKTSALSAA
jgi:glycosyltransferase involved in cell wall biosynthesis